MGLAKLLQDVERSKKQQILENERRSSLYIYNETITDCVSTSENKFAQVKSKELPVSRLLQTKSNRMNVYITTQNGKKPSEILSCFISE